MHTRFFKNAGILAATELLLKLKAFILIPLLTRQLGTTNFGAWSQVAVLVSTIGPIVILGTDSAIFRFLPSCDSRKQKRVFLGWLLFLITGSLIACLLLAAFQRSISAAFWGGEAEYTKLIPLAGLSLVTNQLFTTMRNWFRLQTDAKTYSLAALIQSILNVIAIVAASLVNGGLYRLIEYTIAADLVVGIWLIFRMIQRYGISPPEFSLLPKLIRFGIPLIPMGYAMWVLNFVDRLFLVKYTNLREIGVYALAYGLGYPIIQVIVNPISTMYPSTAADLYDRRLNDDLQVLFRQSLRLLIALAVPAIVGLFVLGKPLLSVLATQDFVLGAPIPAIISVAYLLHMASSYYDISLNLVRKQALSTIAIIIACAVNLLLNWILIPRYSIFGAAIATLIGFATQCFCSYFFAMKYLPMKIGATFVMKVIAASTVMGISLYGLQHLVQVSNLLSLTLLPVIGILLYFFFSLALGLFQLSQLRSLLLHWRKPLVETNESL